MVQAMGELIIGLVVEGGLMIATTYAIMKLIGLFGE